LARQLKECLRDGAFENVKILVSNVFTDILQTALNSIQYVMFMWLSAAENYTLLFVHNAVCTSRADIQNVSSSDLQRNYFRSVNV